MSVNAYVGCKMTGLMCDDMIDAAQIVSVTLVEHGVTPYHPVLKENIPYEHVPLTERSKEEMDVIWNDDKRAIHNSHVLIDTAPHLFSAGLKEEMGKARYRDWKPTVAIYPEGTTFFPRIVMKERDFVTTSPCDAARYIEKMWGTRWRRMKWRLSIYLAHPLDISPRKIVQFFK